MQDGQTSSDWERAVMHNVRLFLLGLVCALAVSPTAEAMRVFEDFHGGVLTLVRYRLTGAAPDFAAFARNTDAYDQASEPEKPRALADEMETMQGIFGEIDGDVRLVWRGTVRLTRLGHSAGRFRVEGLADELGEPLDGYDGAYRLLVGNLAAFRTVTVDAADLPKIGARLGRRGGLVAEAVLAVDGAQPAPTWPKFAIPVLIERLSLSDEAGEILRRGTR